MDSPVAHYLATYAINVVKRTTGATALHVASREALHKEEEAKPEAVEGAETKGKASPSLTKTRNKLDHLNLPPKLCSEKREHTG